MIELSSTLEHENIQASKGRASGPPHLRPLDHSNAISRVQAAIPMAGPCFQWSKDDNRQRPQQLNGISTTNSQASIKGGHRTSKVSTQLNGFYSVYYIIPKKMMAHSPFTTFVLQSIQGFATPHSAHNRGPSGSQTKTVVHHNRSEGHLFSYPSASYPYFSALHFKVGSISFVSSHLVCLCPLDNSPGA